MKMTILDEQATTTREAAPAARIVGGVKIYGTGVTAVRALDAISADFAVGVFTAIMGPSGSGKSTLLHCLAGLDHLTEGQVLIGMAGRLGLSWSVSRSSRSTVRRSPPVRDRSAAPADTASTGPPVVSAAPPSARWSARIAALRSARTHHSVSQSSE